MIVKPVKQGFASQLHDKISAIVLPALERAQGYAQALRCILWGQPHLFAPGAQQWSGICFLAVWFGHYVILSVQRRVSRNSSAILSRQRPAGDRE